MTLYQIDEELAEMLARDEGPSLGAIIRRGIQVGVLVPVEREVYITTCKNHSGGPASPHVLECFKELAAVGGETP